MEYVGYILKEWNSYLNCKPDAGIFVLLIMPKMSINIVDTFKNSKHFFMFDWIHSSFIG